MGSLDKRLKRLEADRKRRGARLTREALRGLSDEELEALEEELLAEARARGEHPSPANEILEEILEEMKRWEAETIDSSTDDEERRKEHHNDVQHPTTDIGTGPGFRAASGAHSRA